MELCPFCGVGEVARIDISALNLRICPNCLATFIPASQFSALRRDLNDTTRLQWRKKLLKKLTSPAPNPASVLCIEHSKPLVFGKIPNFSFEGLTPECCDLQHIPPPLMIKILDVGLAAGNSGIGIGGLGVPRSKLNPVAAFLGGIAFRFWEKRQKKVEDGLDSLQYNYKFKAVLGDWE
ncbi:hypothetical protein AGMMS49938_06790 [Fibrobacterales bacterium]|nr:hypothetical protein AGMMS49938_06790 [Fibrobacterales bacterium]